MKESVLVISNNEDLRKYLDIFLTRNDYVVYKAEHGLKALRILNNSNISVIVYQLISQEFAEFGFFEYINKKHPAICVVTISESTDFQLVMNTMKSGSFDFLPLPVNESDLLKSLLIAIEEKRKIENNIASKKRNDELHKIMTKELELIKEELKETRNDLFKKNIELELIYGKNHVWKDIEKTLLEVHKDFRIGKYKVIEEIGKGGMSVVYKAIDHVLNREVAIKELKIAVHNLPDEVMEDIEKRFQKEAQVIAMLSHDNIVKVFDIIEEDNKRFMIMEYVDGKTLEQIISANKTLPVMETVSIVSEVCLALEYIHNNNIIHRDIKPSNIIIGNDRCVKLTDFGVIRDKSQSTVTPTGSIIGTISYTAPEQSSKNIDSRVDIFSLGIVLYELITGINPFEGTTYADTFIKISSLEPELPSSINKDCPEELDNIVMKSIEKNPSNRYKSAGEFYTELTRFISSYQSSIA